MIPFERAIHERVYKRICLVIAGQCGKTEAMLDVIGQRFDVSPVPTIYVGPTQQFIREQFEPRITELLESTSLSRKTSWGKVSTKTKKMIGGIPLRLAHGGSSSQLKSDPFGLALTDEADELMANVKGAGDPLGLIDVRGDTYSDFVHAITSTPSTGAVDVKLDPVSGLEFWDNASDQVIESAVWRIWESGTRHHWAWPCPHCGEYFIPRFRCLHWDKQLGPDGKEMRSDAMTAQRTAHLVCPRNGCIVTDEHKEAMNERGAFVAPGQKIRKDGAVVGDPPDSWTLSFWVSGLASPFVSWGDRAARYVTAVRSGKQEAIQSVINGGFGELFAPGGGEVPEWTEVAQNAIEYRTGEIPKGVRTLVATVDVQKNRLVYVIRGWGERGTSWLIEPGELYGNTEDPEVWDDLASLLTTPIAGIPIRLMLVDAGYRPGKPSALPVHRVHEFCRRFPNRVRACRGSSKPMRKPILTNKIDIKIDGREYKQGLTHSTLDTDFFKSWVHERIRWPSEAAGAWNLPSDISDDYCMQMVSEARIKTPAGKVKWVQRSRENHLFDCESMQAAAAMMLNLHKLKDGPPAQVKSRQQRQAPPKEEIETPAPARDEAPKSAQAPEKKRPRRPTSGGWLGSGSIW